MSDIKYIVQQEHASGKWYTMQGNEDFLTFTEAVAHVTWLRSDWPFSAYRIVRVESTVVETYESDHKASLT